jgi:hypothetical protein
LAKDVPFGFIEACLKAFETLNKALTYVAIIQPPDWSLPFEIMCDTSDFAVGVVLGQCKDKKHHAIAYASKTLIGPQLNYASNHNYSPLDRQLDGHALTTHTYQSVEDLIHTLPPKRMASIQ